MIDQAQARLLPKGKGSQKTNPKNNQVSSGWFIFLCIRDEQLKQINLHYKAVYLYLTEL